MLPCWTAMFTTVYIFLPPFYHFLDVAKVVSGATKKRSGFLDTKHLFSLRHSVRIGVSGTLTHTWMKWIHSSFIPSNRLRTWGQKEQKHRVRSYNLFHREAPLCWENRHSEPHMHHSGRWKKRFPRPQSRALIAARTTIDGWIIESVNMLIFARMSE